MNTKKVLIGVLSFLIASTAFSQTMSYRGRLVKANGQPLTDPAKLRFEIVKSSDDTILCRLDKASVGLSNGVFNADITFPINLGFNPSDVTFDPTNVGCESGKKLSTIFKDNAPGTLSMRVSDHTTGAAVPYPKQQITSAPSAIVAETLNGYTKDDFIMNDLLHGGGNMQTHLNNFTDIAAVMGTNKSIKWDGTQWIQFDPSTGTLSAVNPTAPITASITGSTMNIGFDTATTALTKYLRKDVNDTMGGNLTVTGTLTANGALSATAGISANTLTVTGDSTSVTINGQKVCLEDGTNCKDIIAYPGSSLQYYRGDKTWAVLDTSVVPENGNLYFTNARAQAAALTATISGLDTTHAPTSAVISAIPDGSTLEWDGTGQKMRVKANGITSLELADNVSVNSIETTGQNALELKPFGISPEQTGELRFFERAVNGPQFVGFKAPDEVDLPLLQPGLVWTLPTKDGGPGAILKTDGAGNLSWYDASGITPGGPAGGDLDGSYPNPVVAANVVDSSKITDGTIANSDVSPTAGIAATKLVSGVVDNTEFNALNGITSNIQGQLNLKEGVLAPGVSTQYYRGDKTWASLNTTVVPEGTNKYFTDLRAQTAVVYDGLTAGVTNKAPSMRAMYDQLALKMDNFTVDNTTIEWNGAQLRVKDNGITSTKIVDGTIVDADISAAARIDISKLWAEPLDGCFAGYVLKANGSGILTCQPDAGANGYSLKSKNGSLLDVVHVNNLGNVGVAASGMTTAEYQLDVRGNAANERQLHIGQTTSAGGMILGSNEPGEFRVKTSESGTGTNVGTTAVQLYGRAGDIMFGAQTGRTDTAAWADPTQRMVIQGSTGNVGIGLANPGAYRLNVTGDTNVTGNTNVTANSTIGGTLGVTGATTLSSTLGVTGNTVLGGTLGVTGATTLSNTLGVTGNTTIGGTLGVTGNTTLTGDLAVNGGDITASGNLNITPTTGLTLNPIAGNVAVNLAGGDDFTVNTNQFVIDSATGNIGVGTAAPGAFRLNVTGGSTRLQSALTVDSTTPFSTIYLSNNGTNQSSLFYHQAASSTVLQTQGAESLVFGTNSAEKMRISPTGNIGIGTNNPLYKLDVTGSGHFTGDLTIDGALNVAGGASFTGGDIDMNTKRIYEIGTENSQFTADGSLNIGASKMTVAATTGNTAVAGTLGVTGNTTLGGTLGVTGNTTLTGDLAVNGGDITSTGALTVTPLAGTNFNVATSGAGNLAVNTNQFVVQSTNGNIGMGTATPGKQLDVTRSDAHTGLRVQNTSSTTARYPHLAVENYDGTGFGGSSALNLLYAKGSAAAPLAAAPSTLVGGLGYYAHNGTAFANIGGVYMKTSSTYTGANNNAIMTFETGSAGVASQKMVLNSAGYLGIGVIGPTVALDVAGSGHLSGDLTVDGNLTIGGATGITFNGTGNLDMQQGRVYNIGIGNVGFTASGDLDMAGNGTVISNIGVAGTDFTATGGLTMAGALQVNNNAAITGTLGVTGNTTLAGDLAVNGGDITSTGALNITPVGNLNIDSNTLFVDTTNNRVGLGTAAPSAAFHATKRGNGAATESSMIIGDDLAVSTALGVEKITVGNLTNSSQLLIGQDASHGLDVGWIYSPIPANAYARIDTFGGSNHLALQTSGGNVGINTIAPSSKLEVNGAAEVTTLLDNNATNFFEGTGGEGVCTAGEMVSGITSAGTFTCVSLTGTLDSTYVNIAGDTMTGNLDMSNNLVLNVGAAGTDFTAGGGLNLAGDLAVNGGDITSTGGLNITPVGNLNIDNNTLFVDVTNHRVGVGMTNPAAPLDVLGSIRTTSLTDGFMKMWNYGGGPDNLGFQVQQVNTAAASGRDMVFNNWGTTDQGGWRFINTNVNNGVVRITSTGNLGIGTMAPAMPLDVVGNGHFSGNLTVDGNLTIGGATGITFNGTGNLDMQQGRVYNIGVGNVGFTASGDLDMAGNGTVISNIGVAGTDFTATGGLTMAGALQVNNNAAITGTLGVTGNTTLTGDLAVNGGDITSTGALTVTPNAGTNLNVALSGTGDFAVNTNQLYVDTSAARVGIGAAAPATKLEMNVTAATNDGLRITGPATVGTTVSTSLYGNLTALAFNPLTQVGDNGIFFAGTTTAPSNAKGFLIAPYNTSAASGLRMTANGDTTLAGNMTITKDLTVTGALNVGGGLSFTGGDIDMNTKRIYEIGTNNSQFTADGSLTIGATQATISSVNGNIVTAGDLAVNGGDITSTGALNITPTGNLNIDSNTLFVDTTANRVGINTNAPVMPLHLQGGDMMIKDPTDSAMRGIYFVPSDNSARNSITALQTASAGTDYLQLNSMYGSVRFSKGSPSAPTELMRLTSTGQLGIGTATPTTEVELVREDGSGAYFGAKAYRNNPNGGGFVASHARGTVAAPLVINSGDTLGIMEFRGYSAAAAAFRTSAVILSTAGSYDTAADATDAPGDLRFYTTSDGTDAPTQRMVINSEGKIGVNNTAPDEQFTVTGPLMSKNIAIAYDATGANENRAGILFGANHATNNAQFFITPDATTGNKLHISNGSALNDTTPGTNGFTFSNNGMLGIKDTTPTYNLDVNGTGHFAGDLTIDGNVTIGGATGITFNGTGNLDMQQGRVYNIGTGNTAFAINGDLDMNSTQVLLNIGNAGTDFTNVGGLNLAGSLNVNGSKFLVDGATGNVAIANTGGAAFVMRDTDGAGIAANTYIAFQDSAGVRTGFVGDDNSGSADIGLASDAGKVFIRGYTGVNVNPDSGNIAFTLAGGADFTVNTNQLVVDSATGNTGVGTATPGAYKLNVQGTMNVSSDAAFGTGVGIGGARDATIWGGWNNSLQLTKTQQAAITYQDPTSDRGWLLGFHGLDDRFYIGKVTSWSGDTGSYIMTVDGGTSRVGIGTTAPAYKLDVAGTGHFTGDLTVDGNLTIGGATGITFNGTGNLDMQQGRIYNIGTGNTNFTAVGDLDLNATQVISNIGSWGTDFTTSGGLNLAGDLNVNGGKFAVTGATGDTTIAGRVTLTSPTDSQLYIKDSNGAGNAAATGIEFQDSAGVRKGFVGDGSTGDADVSLISDAGIAGIKGATGVLLYPTAGNVAVSLAGGADFTVNTNHFVVDTATGRVGVATATPDRKLQVATATANDGISLTSVQTVGNTVRTSIYGNLAELAYNPITQVGDNGIIFSGTLNSPVNAKGFVIAPENAIASGLRMANNGDTTLTGNMTITKNLTVSGVLNVAGGASFTGGDINMNTKRIYGIGTANSQFTADGSLNIGNTPVKMSVASATGNTAIAGTLGVTGATTLSGTLGVTGATTLSSTLGVTGNTTLTGDLAVNGGDITSSAATLTINPTTTIALAKNTSVTGTLGVSGATTLSSTLGVTGNTTLSTLSTSGLATLNSASITNNATVGGTLGVTGNTTLTGDLAVNGGDITSTGALNITPVGNLNIDTDTLFVNVTNNRIGMGTNAPAAPLHMIKKPNAVATDSAIIFGDNIAPSSGLNAEKITIGSTDSDSVIFMGQDATHNLVAAWKRNAIVANAYGLIETFSGNNPLVLQSGGGYVGLGITNPAYKLDVAGSGHFTGNLTVDGALNIAGGASFTGGDINMNTKRIYGIGTANSQFTADGSLNIGASKLTVASATGNTAIAGTLGVTGATTLSSTLGVTGATTLSSTLAVTGNTTLTGDLAVNGGDITSSAATLTINPTTSISLAKNTSVTGTLGVSGATTLSSTLGVTGNTSLSTLSTSGLATLNSASVTNNATVGGTLGVTGNTTLTGDLAVNGGDITSTAATLTLNPTTTIALARNTNVTGKIAVSAAGSTFPYAGAGANSVVIGNPATLGANNAEFSISLPAAATHWPMISALNGTVNFGIDQNGFVRPSGIYDMDGSNFFDGGCTDGQYITGIDATGAISCGSSSGSTFDGRFVNVTGDTMTGALTVNSTATVTGLLTSGKLIANTTSAAVAAGSQLNAVAGSTAQGQRAGVSFYPTFEGTGDNGARKAADIIGGYNGGAWGSEFLSFHVGRDGAANDTQNLTNERMRIAGNGNVGIATGAPSSKLEVTGSIETGGLLDNDASNFFDLSGCADGSYLSAIDSTGAVTCTASTKTFVGNGGGWGTLKDGGTSLDTITGASPSGPYSFNRAGGVTGAPGGSEWWHAWSKGHSDGGWASQIVQDYFNNDGMYYRTRNNGVWQGWNQVASRTWVNANTVSAATGDTNYVNVTGDTMTGALSLGTNTLTAGAVNTSGKMSINGGNVLIGGFSGTPDYSAYNDSIVGTTNLWLSSRNGGILGFNPLAGSGNVTIGQSGSVNVGIGLGTPGVRLDVSGVIRSDNTIQAKQLVVNKPGSGNYDISSFSGNGTVSADWEGPLAADDAGAARVPIQISWRGGYGAKGGMRLDENANANFSGTIGVKNDIWVGANPGGTSSNALRQSMADNDNWKIYGEGASNTGQMVIETGDDSAEPIIFRTAGGASPGDFVKFNPDGQIWTEAYGWLTDKFVSTNVSQDISGKKYFIGSANTNGGDDSTATLEVRGTGGADGAGISFHRPGQWASKLVLGSDNAFHFGGWSNGTDGATVKAGTFVGNLTGTASNAHTVDGFHMNQPLLTTDTPTFNRLIVGTHGDWTGSPADLAFGGNGSGFSSSLNNDIYWHNQGGAAQGWFDLNGDALVKRGGKIWAYNGAYLQVDNADSTYNWKFLMKPGATDATNSKLYLTSGDETTAEITINKDTGNLISKGNAEFVGGKLVLGEASALDGHIRLNSATDFASTWHIFTQADGSGNTPLYITTGNAPSTLASVFTIRDDGSTYMEGNLTIYGNFFDYSDKRLKENIKALPSTLKKVLALNPVSYQKKISKRDKINGTKTKPVEMGFIAQEMKELFPEFVLVPPEKDGLMAISYSHIAVVLTKAIQEQQAIIDANKKQFELMHNGLQQRVRVHDVILIQLQNENKSLKQQMATMRQEIDEIKRLIKSAAPVPAQKPAAVQKVPVRK